MFMSPYRVVEFEVWGGTPTGPDVYKRQVLLYDDDPEDPTSRFPYYITQKSGVRSLDHAEFFQCFAEVDVYKRQGLYSETQKKRRGCAYCHNVRTCTIRKIGMTCHGRRTRKKAKPCLLYTSRCV